MAVEVQPAAAGGVCIVPVRGLPEIRPGDDLAALIAAATGLQDGDVIVVAQKVVSKAEGALDVPRPGEGRADARRRLAREQARRIVADAPWALIVETSHGFVCANAGIDASNVPGESLTLLPSDPDASARRLRHRLVARTGADIAVIVADTFGRPWRVGQTDVAIGVSGLAVIDSEVGARDRDGMVLEVSEAAVVDEVAGAADLVRRKADGVPVVVVRGLSFPRDDRARATDLVRPADLDLFARGRGGVADALATMSAGTDGPPAAEANGGLDGPVSADDRRRALRAASHDDVSVAATDGDRATSFSITGSPAAQWRVGVAAGLLMAALVDLGYAVGHRAGGADSIVVRAGRPARRGRGSDSGR